MTASEYGVVVDIPFPAVDPAATKEDILALADKIVEEIKECEPEAVMCQGEFTLTYAIVRRLSDKGIPVFAACSERKVVETIDKATGKYEKTARFEFVGFREYSY